jgi:putative endonuclease
MGASEAALKREVEDVEAAEGAEAKEGGEPAVGAAKKGGEVAVAAAEKGGEAAAAAEKDEYVARAAAEKSGEVAAGAAEKSGEVAAGAAEKSGEVAAPAAEKDAEPAAAAAKDAESAVSAAKDAEPAAKEKAPAKKRRRAGAATAKRARKKTSTATWEKASEASEACAVEPAYAPGDEPGGEGRLVIDARPKDDEAQDEQRISILDMTGKQLGAEGERLARVYLRERGYTIVERNWRCGKGEADIVALDKRTGETVLIEVKTRVDLGAERSLIPELSVTSKKQRIYRMLALAYLSMHANIHAIRFDVIAITIVREHHANLRHLRSAYVFDEA